MFGKKAVFERQAMNFKQTEKPILLWAFTVFIWFLRRDANLGLHTSAIVNACKYVYSSYNQIWTHLTDE
jgi:hypothetical protein